MQLLFDLDGTLTDSRRGIFNCLRHALTSHGLTMPPEDGLLWCIGPPIQQSLRKLIGPDAPELFEPVLISYRERYASIGLFENELYPDIVEALKDARDRGHTLHVATSKAEVFAKRIIPHFGLDAHFTSVTGSELDGTRSDKAEIIAHILKRECIDPAQAIMIGDREHDMIGARKNGIPAIGALWGYGTGRELIESGATLCARTPRLIAELIASLE
jgi:phosphoglycolate phosphatase